METTSTPSRLLARIEYYHDADPRNPRGWSCFQRRLAALPAEVAARQWRTVVMDSATSAEILARLQAKAENPEFRGQAQQKWWGQSTDELENVCYVRFGALPCNVILVAHIDNSKVDLQGAALRVPSLPGRLAKSIAGMYSEIYRADVVMQDQVSYVLQCRKSPEFFAATQIDAGDERGLVYPSYSSLWANWGKTPVPLHVLVYGDPGTGKSTFAATFPKPLLVLCFDGYGKDIPYLRIGNPSQLQLNRDLGFPYRDVEAEEKKETQEPQGS